MMKTHKRVQDFAFHLHKRVQFILVNPLGFGNNKPIKYDKDNMIFIIADRDMNYFIQVKIDSCNSF